MNRTYVKKASSVSLHRERFIIPPTGMLKPQSQHTKTCATTSVSFKKNIHESSISRNSWSNQNLPRYINQISTKTKKDSDCLYSTDETFHPINSPEYKNNKFKLLKRKSVFDADWAKWKKNRIDVSDKKFTLKLNSKVQKRIIPIEQQKKQHSEIFMLKHKFRQISQLKKTVEKAQHNNDLIKRLKEESNQKIMQFFGRYEKYIQQSIK